MRISRKIVLPVSGVILAVTAAGALWMWQLVDGLDPTNPKVTLRDVEATVSRLYRVPEIDANTLTANLSKPNVVVFDVREEDEFAKSHLPGARRIDPGMSAEAFMAKYGQELQGKEVVFYCAVGVRSGRLLSRVENKLPSAGVTSAKNLRGGIFRWHASQGALVTDTGAPASGVHHFDDNWSQLLQRSLPPK